MESRDSRMILVVDDNPFNREGLVLYLENKGYSTCQAGDRSEAISVASRCNPDGAIVDIVIPVDATSEAQMDDSVGLEVVGWLKKSNPSMGIVIFSAYDDRGREVLNMVRNGSHGLAYILKGASAERLLQALEQAMAGNVILDPDALTNARHLRDEIRKGLSPEERPWVERAVKLFSKLSDRELQVATRLANSQNLSGIAGSLGVHQSTVENHITSLYSVLQLSQVDKLAPSLRKSILLAKSCMLYQLDCAEASVS